MNILLASDDNYTPLLAVTLYSLLENNEKEFDNINIYVLDGGISEYNKKRITSLCDEFDVKTPIEFIKNDNLEELVGMKIKATRALSAYSRLFAANLLPDNIDKIIYLDCDALVVDSLKKVWQMDIDNYYCGAVYDIAPQYNNLYLNFPKDWVQYNSGFLLINLKKWREDNLEQAFLDMIIENNGEVFHNDQGIINVICKNKIYTLPPHYNIRSPFFEVGYDKFLQWYGIDEYYTKEEVEDALEHPVFIHLTQFVNGRPWFTNATNHPLRELFDSYVQKTDFRDEIYIEDNRKLPGKFLSFTYKILPYSVVCWLFSIYRFLIMKKLDK